MKPPSDPKKTNPIQTQSVFFSLRSVVFSLLSVLILPNRRPVEQGEVGNSRANAGVQYPDSHLVRSNARRTADSLVANRLSIGYLLPFVVYISINGEPGNALAVVADLFLEHHTVEGFFGVQRNHQFGLCNPVGRHPARRSVPIERINCFEARSTAG